MIHITFRDYKREASVLTELVAELRSENIALKDEADVNRARLGDAKTQHEHDSDHIRELNLTASELCRELDALRKRLQELQSKFVDKCKECEKQEKRVNELLSENTMIFRELDEYRSEGTVIVEEDEFAQLKADAKKFRDERDKRNANRRKRRASKKVAHAKP